MRIKVLLFFVLAGFCSAGPVAAASRFVVLSARHGFSIPRIAHGAVLRAHSHSYGGAGGAYDAWLGGDYGGYPITPDDSTGALPPLPYPPAVYYPAYYAPQPHCVRPKIIYLTDEKPVANPPRIIYGTPPLQCN
jgi:hypothetical protein